MKERSHVVGPQGVAIERDEGCQLPATQVINQGVAAWHLVFLFAYVKHPRDHEIPHRSLEDDQEHGEP